MTFNSAQRERSDVNNKRKERRYKCLNLSGYLCLINVVSLIG